MTDILHKIFSQRIAIAQATVQVSKQETIDAIENKTVPKGNVFEFARAAALFAIKRTSDVIPDCHPLPIEYTKIEYEINKLDIKIRIEVATVYKTGVEVEAMHGASIAALTLYDMLKPIDKKIEIQHIKLIEKSGGKNDFYNQLSRPLKTAIVVCSDSVFAQKKEDKAGLKVKEILESFCIEHIQYSIIPDEKTHIQSTLKNYIEDKIDLVLFVGGTGLSPRDVTPEAISDLIDRTIPGIMEAARQYGQQRTPYAMLSRGVAGFCQQTLVLTLPGSTKGAQETMQALFPALFHVFKVAEGNRHEK